MSKMAGEEFRVDARMAVPTTGDVAQQVRAIEDMIAQQVDGFQQRPVSEG
jgi:ABC-type sugar transport system substrate-binding protein